MQEPKKNDDLAFLEQNNQMIDHIDQLIEGFNAGNNKSRQAQGKLKKTHAENSDFASYRVSDRFNLDLAP